MSLAHSILLRGFCLAAGYLFGCFLTAEIVARCVAGVSAREIGTGNPGMANIMANLGKPAGFVVLAGDALKTAAACWFCYKAAAPEIGMTSLLYGGFGAVLGHNFPFWAHGKGGKGVATSCTWLMLYLPIAGVLCCLAGGAAVLATGYLPLGAVLITALVVPAGWWFYGTESGLILLANACLMVFMHRHGLQRMRSGKEPRHFLR